MTMTAVTLGDSTPDGGWAEGDWDCATDASANADITKGKIWFIDLTSISVLILVAAAFRSPV
jgi:hypothetical protein